MKTVVMILALSIPAYAGCDTFANGNFIRCDDGPTVFDLPPKRWTPLLSSFWSRKVFYGYGTSSISG
jgi:hypothetical protein